MHLNFIDYIKKEEKEKRKKQKQDEQQVKKKIQTKIEKHNDSKEDDMYDPQYENDDDDDDDGDNDLNKKNIYPKKSCPFGFICKYKHFFNKVKKHKMKRRTVKKHIKYDHDNDYDHIGLDDNVLYNNIILNFLNKLNIEEENEKYHYFYVHNIEYDNSKYDIVSIRKDMERILRKKEKKKITSFSPVLLLNYVNKKYSFIKIIKKEKKKEKKKYK